MFAMAGTMDHLSRILGDMTNAIEQLGTQWEEKSLTIVAGPYTENKAGDVVEIISNNGRRWVWRVVDGMEALGTWLDSRGCSEASLWHRIFQGFSMFYEKKALLCDPKLTVKRRVHAFHSTCAYTQSMFQALRIWELGKLRRVLCLRRRTNECWADHTKRTASHCCSAVEKAWSTTFTNVGDTTCANCFRCPDDAQGRRYWEESVTWRCDEEWREANIKLSKEDYRNSTQKRPLLG